MPTYTYNCDDCNQFFEMFFYIKDYTDNPKCINCGKKHTYRMYTIDVSSQSASVKKSDGELKTLGDLAKRNTDRLSDDEKAHLYQKHNDYKENKIEEKPLPKGMSRIQKPEKPIWPH